MKDKSDLFSSKNSQLISLQFKETGSINHYLSRIRSVQPSHNLKKGRFSGTGTPHNRCEFSSLNLQSRVVYCFYNIFANMIILYQIRYFYDFAHDDFLSFSILIFLSYHSDITKPLQKLLQFCKGLIFFKIR